MESYSAASLVGRENYAVTTTVLYAAGVPGATNTGMHLSIFFPLFISLATQDFDM